MNDDLSSAVAAVPSPTLPGTRIADKYIVEQVLGEGGFGVVVSAVHEVLGERVAIKFLLPQALVYPGVKERFLREAQAAVRVRSEHVARVTDVGTMPSGMPYMVMEHLVGHDLERFVEAQGPVSVTQACDWVLQACEAIAEAHSMGIIHRDLKLPNLFLTSRADGSHLIKVLDFGISKQITEGVDSGNLTKTASMLGSPLYMSPEQLRNAKSVDVRTDLWALGVILYRLVSHRYPFDDEDGFASLVAAVMTEPPRPLSTYVGALPAGFEAVVMRCLQRDVGQRHLDVAALSEALLPYASPGMAMSVQRIVATLERRGQRVSRVSLEPQAVSSSAAGSMPGSPATPGLSREPSYSAASSAAASPGLVTQGEWNRSLSEPVDLPRPRVPGWVLGSGAIALLLGVGAIAMTLRGTSPSDTAAGSAPIHPVGLEASAASASASAAAASAPGQGGQPGQPGQVGQPGQSGQPGAASQGTSVGIDTLESAAARPGSKAGMDAKPRATDGAPDAKNKPKNTPGAGAPATPATPPVTTVPTPKNDDNRKSW